MTVGRGKVTGVLLCLLAILTTGVVVWGLVQQEWWAVAVPVAVLMVVAMTLLFWVGWTFISTDAEPPQAPL